MIVFLAIAKPAGSYETICTAKADTPKAFCDAVHDGNTEKVKSFLEKDPSLANTECINQFGWPLAMASINGYTEIVRVLLAKGALVNAKGPCKDTALHWAAQAGRYEIAGMLIAAGAKINVKNKFGVAPLYWAAANGHLNVVKLLVEKGADVNIDAGKGTTPLKAAMDKKHTDVVHFLKSRGAR